MLCGKKLSTIELPAPHFASKFLELSETFSSLPYFAWEGFEGMVSKFWGQSMIVSQKPTLPAIWIWMCPQVPTHVLLLWTDMWHREGCFPQCVALHWENICYRIMYPVNMPKCYWGDQEEQPSACQKVLGWVTSFSQNTNRESETWKLVSWQGLFFKGRAGLEPRNYWASSTLFWQCTGSPARVAHKGDSGITNDP